MDWAFYFKFLIYSATGAAILLLSYISFDALAGKTKLTEILVEDKNVGLGIVVAGLLISMAILMAAVLR